MSRPFAALLALILWLTAQAGMAEPIVAHLAGEAEIRDQGGDVLLTVPLSEPVPWKTWMADDPPRLIVEFNDLDWDAEPKVGSSSIAEVRIERSAPHWSRLVAYLREPLSVTQAEMASDEDGATVLALVLGPTTGAAFKEHAGSLEAPSTVTTPEKTIVVIDPGHGGRDPGAVAGEINEADLMLTFALSLQAALEETGLFDVVLTREADVFVPLTRRLTYARDADADVFLSFHADRLVDGAGEASGVTLYALGHGARGEGETVARAAPTDILKGVDLADAGDEVALALMALQRQSTDPRTAALSSTLLKAFVISGVEVNSRPERQADFRVLKAADIPSLLVELGFLSSDADLERLNSVDWRDKTIMALRDGLMQWVQEDRVFRDAMGK